MNCNPLNLMVGMTRFELATPCSRSRCATRLRYIPKNLFSIRFEAFCQGERRCAYYSPFLLSKQTRPYLLLLDTLLFRHIL